MLPSMMATRRARVLALRSRGFLSAAHGLAKKQMPKMSETERVALGAGTVGFDRDIFTGTPSLQHLLDTYACKLTPEEQSFLDNECEQLCSLLNDHRITIEKDMPREVWDFLRDQGFFAMKIPTEWGGKGFSTHCVSTVLAKIGMTSSDAQATVAVPNSLGPGELLARYGTDAQQKYFLPAMANGTLIPCFGLTGPHSGSDATSLIGSHGVVEARDGVLGVRATFDKRYITLAPVAGVVGLGLDLKDPDNLLQGDGAEGFTVALLERGHEGLQMGDRHMPLNCAFMNGTVKGQDVWLPMASVLGGQSRCGFGWHMFVECLAEGRGVSLPAGALSAARGVCAGVGAYARVRKQFRVPIAEFGGIQEALARAARDSYIILGGTELTNAIVDNHEAPMVRAHARTPGGSKPRASPTRLTHAPHPRAPPTRPAGPQAPPPVQVLSSIMKQSCTERGRRVVTDGMDIAGGAGICRGEMNYIANAYMAMPVAITVEGANIMTRSFQIIGQGLTRCHPHMLPLIESLGSSEPDAPSKFGRQFGNMLKHVFTNLGLSWSRGLGATLSAWTRSAGAHTDGRALVAHHEAQVCRDRG